MDLLLGAPRGAGRVPTPARASRPLPGQPPNLNIHIGAYRTMSMQQPGAEQPWAVLDFMANGESARAVRKLVRRVEEPGASVVRWSGAAAPAAIDLMEVV